MNVDLVSVNLGTIIVITPASVRGRAWMRRNVPDSRQTRSGAVDCEHRCGIDILLGAKEAGLRLQDARTGRVSD